MSTCKFEGCDKVVICKGLCSGHYSQYWKGQELKPLRVRRTGTETCAVCPDRARNFSSGQPLCNKHHVRWKMYGDPVKATKLMVRPVGEAAIADAVANRDRSKCWTDWSELPCWEGLGGYGGAMRNGYPMIGKSTKVMWLAMTADGRPRPAAPANQGLHSCDTPACWNPSHLRWGTHEENLADRAGKMNYCTHCPHCNPEG